MENVKTKQNITPTYHRWHQLCMMYTGTNVCGVKLAPQGEGPYLFDEKLCPLYVAWGGEAEKLAHLGEWWS